MDDLVGVRMLHMTSGTVVTIRDRKTDDSGWWVRGGGGLGDGVIADGTWRPLSEVLAVARAHFSASAPGSVPLPYEGDKP